MAYPPAVTPRPIVAPGNQAAGYSLAVKQLTNAQIKALATDPPTPVELVAAPGAGKVIVSQAYVTGGDLALLLHQQADYTNIDAAATLRTFLGDDSGPMAVFKNAVIDAVFDSGAPNDVYLAPTADDLDSSEAQAAAAVAAWADQPLMIDIDNGSTGALTGGHANNKLTVFVWYRVIDLSHV